MGLKIGLEFDGEYSDPVRKELEQILAALQIWQAQVGSVDAQYFVGAADPTLTAERVGQSSESVRVDLSSDGVVRWHVDGSVFGAGAMLGSGGGEEGEQGPPGRDGTIGTVGATGPTGATGANGMTTAFPFDGEDGDQWGLPGPMGPTGATGSTPTLFWTVVAAASDQNINTNTTLTDDAELFFTMTAAKLYAVEVYILYSSAAGAGTPDIKFAFKGPATFTSQWATVGHVTTADSFTAAYSQQTGVTVGTLGTVATPRLCRLNGWAYSSAGGTGTSGFMFQWAQNTSDANNTTRLAGSVVRYRQLSA